MTSVLENKTEGQRRPDQAEGSPSVGTGQACARVRVAVAIPEGFLDQPEP